MEALKNVSKYWTLIAFVGYVIVTWTINTAKIQALSEKQLILEQRVQQTEQNYTFILSDISDIKSGISSLNTSIKYIEKIYDAK